MFWWFCFCFEFRSYNATLFCNSKFVHLSEKDAGHEWAANPLIWTPVYGSVIPRIASFTMMDSLAYWNRARIGGRHSSGTSFKPGAPRHSTCLGSPEFYRRSEGDFGWWVKTLRYHAYDRGFPSKRSGENENISEPTTSPLRIIIRYRCIYKDLSLYNRRTFRKTDLFRNLSRNRR